MAEPSQMPTFTMPLPRERMIREVREALDADPSTPETGADIPNDIGDGELFQKWMRA